MCGVCVWQVEEKKSIEKKGKSKVGWNKFNFYSRNYSRKLKLCCMDFKNLK